MASNIEDNKIFLTRGDTFEATISIYRKNGTPYVPQEGDTVTFAIKEAKMTPGNQNFVNKDPLVFKTIPISTMLLSITPNDTKDLKFGNYKYDIELVMSSGKVYTFIDDEDFILTPEVH